VHSCYNASMNKTIRRLACILGLLAVTHSAAGSHLIGETIDVPPLASVAGLASGSTMASHVTYVTIIDAITDVEYAVGVPPYRLKSPITVHAKEPDRATSFGRLRLSRR
jgi:hypothetical protein